MTVLELGRASQTIARPTIMLQPLTNRTKVVSFNSGSNIFGWCVFHLFDPLDLAKSCLITISAAL